MTPAHSVHTGKGSAAGDHRLHRPLNPSPGACGLVCVCVCVMQWKIQATVLFLLRWRVASEFPFICATSSLRFYKKYYLFICLCQILVVARGLSWSAACGILAPLPGFKPTSPALQGGFLTTGPPGKSLSLHFYKEIKSAQTLAKILCIFAPYSYFKELDAFSD